MSSDLNIRASPSSISRRVVKQAVEPDGSAAPMSGGEPLGHRLVTELFSHDIHC